MPPWEIVCCATSQGRLRCPSINAAGAYLCTAPPSMCRKVPIEIVFPGTVAAAARRRCKWRIQHHSFLELWALSARSCSHRHAHRAAMRLVPSMATTSVQRSPLPHSGASFDILHHTPPLTVFRFRGLIARLAMIWIISTAQENSLFRAIKGCRCCYIPDTWKHHNR